MKGLNLSRREKTLLALFIVATLAIPVTYVYAASLPQVVIGPGIGISEASYIIFKDGSTYYARNGRTGALDYSNIDLTILSQTVENVVDDLGGTILLKEIQKPSGLKISNGVLIIEDYQGTRRYYSSSTSWYESSGEIIGVSYYIYGNTTHYLARSGSTGKIDYVDSSFSNTFNYAADLLVYGGVVQLAGQRFPVDAELGIDYRGISVLGMGNNLTVLYATSNINILRIKLPAYGTGHNYMENYEAGEGIFVKGIQFWDKADSPASYGAAIVLDNSVTDLTGVTISECVFVGVYDGIVNYRGSGTKYLWSNTIEKCKFSLFRHYAIYFENIADTILSDIWAVTDLSTVSAIYYKNVVGGSTKIGGNILDKVRVFNEATNPNSHGLYVLDYHEMWISNSIFDFCGGWGAIFNNTYSVWCTGDWFSSNSRSGAGGGVLICSNPHHLTTYGNGYDVQFTNCYAENNDSGDGFRVQGDAGHIQEYVIFVNCIARSNNAGNGFYLIYARYCSIAACVSATNTNGLLEADTCSYNSVGSMSHFRANTSDDFYLAGTGSQAHQYWDGSSFVD